MKTQILQLEPHDDIISTRDKLGWVQAARIVLVWPARGRILTRRLDLIMLQRASVRIGAQLAIVTRDPVVIDHAEELEIPVFKTLRKAQNSRWRGKRQPRLNLERQKPRPDFYAVRQQIHPKRTAWHERPFARPAFYAFTLLILISTAAAIFPGAQITVTPKSQRQTLTIPVRAGEQIEGVNLSGELPARVQTVVVEGRDSLEASGTVPVPSQSATGRVRFSNLTGQEVRVPAGTWLTTGSGNPQRFITTQDASVPAGIGASTSVPVQAGAPGEQGNVPAGAITGIEGPLGLSLTVSNVLKLENGANLDAPGPARQDYTRLYLHLYDTLRQTALSELEGEAAPGNIVLAPTLEMAEVLEKTFDPAMQVDGELPPGGEIELTLRLEFTALVVPAAEVQAFAEAVLDANLPEAYRPLPGTLEIISVGDFQQDENGLTRFDLEVRRTLQAEVDRDQAAQIAAGQEPAAAAEELLQAFPLRFAPVIDISPDWWPRLPVLSWRIDITQP